MVSLLLDHIGFLGLRTQRITRPRVFGAVCVLAGCMLSGYDKLAAGALMSTAADAGVPEKVALMAWAVFAGSCLPVQAGDNQCAP